MLKRLRIENYGLIASAEIDFAGGATIFSGETGSGKTMLVGALAFALGARADQAAATRDAERTVVTLAFEPDDALLRHLNAEGFDVDPGEEATIVREMTPAGKSNLRVNGRPATAGVVREFAAQVAEIVGQHEAQRLLSSAYHLELLDRFGGSKALEARAATEGAYAHATALRETLAAMESQEQSVVARLGEARYALDEIVAAAPDVGEDDRLTARRRYLDNVERIVLALRGAHAALAGEETSVTGAIGAASAALDSVGEVAPALRELAGELGALQSEANDLAARLSRELDASEYDPMELERINGRLDVLDRLKRKYGGSLDAVLAYAREAEATLRDHEHRGERGAELTAAAAAAERDLVESAARFGKLRREAARVLVKRIAAELGDLALGSATFDVAFEPLERIGRSGGERVEFQFSANAGEAMRPLTRIISGGELSRVLLALVVALAEARERTALVFDEIDAGIGGATAVAVGARIGRLARNGQVICVTHLAQLATWAERHYVLEKHERRGATFISVREIDNAQERTNEIARMLSGEPHDAALKHAREMLARTRAATT
ncbi:MAG TPA: DNA repair protein RecN [Candidatus Tyrphobacter sp.]